jgi:perosamine synthetase
MTEKKFIPVNEPLLIGNEKKYLNQCIDTGWISSEGAFVREFEEKFSAKVSRKYGIAVANGSVALEVAIAALGIGKGDEIIMPAFTIISCAAAVVRAGALPVLIDSYPHTWNMNINHIEKKITHKTKAIMVVHIYGLPVNMKPVLEIAQKYNLKIIEDAAQMHGQTYNNKACGSFGDISTFSFYPNKHVTTGEGGMLVTDKSEIAEKCRSLRNLCFQPHKRFVHEELGWNFRMSNIQAAVGAAQLEKLDDFIKIKKSIGRKYNQLLRNVDGIELPLEKTEYAENIYWVYGIVLKDGIPFDVSDLMKKLSTKKIGTRPFFWCMHEQPVFQKMGLFYGEKYPIAEKLARRGFYIPSGLAVTDEQIEIVAKAITGVFR